MLFYMNSKELVKYFLPFERDKDIPNGWYVLVSSRISGRSADTSENIISAKNIFFIVLVMKFVIFRHFV